MIFFFIESSKMIKETNDRSIIICHPRSCIEQLKIQ